MLTVDCFGKSGCVYCCLCWIQKYEPAYYLWFSTRVWDWLVSKNFECSRQRFVLRWPCQCGWRNFNIIQEPANCFVFGARISIALLLAFLVIDVKKGKRLFLPSMYEYAWVCTDEYGPIFAQARVYINLKERAHVYTDDFAPAPRKLPGDNTNTALAQAFSES